MKQAKSIEIVVELACCLSNCITPEIHDFEMVNKQGFHDNIQDLQLLMIT